MYMLINFIYMLQVIYKSFKCRLRFVQSAFIHKEFCMQENKVRAFIRCSSSVMSEKSVGLIENLVQLNHFSSKHISNLTLYIVSICSHARRLLPYSFKVSVDVFVDRLLTIVERCSFLLIISVIET